MEKAVGEMLGLAPDGEPNDCTRVKAIKRQGHPCNELCPGALRPVAAHVLQAHLTQANEGDGAGVSRGQPGSLGLMANHECCIVKVFTQVTA